MAANYAEMGSVSQKEADFQHVLFVHIFLGRKKSAQLKKFYCKLVSEFNPSSVHKMAEC